MASAVGNSAALNAVQRTSSAKVGPMRIFEFVAYWLLLNLGPLVLSLVLGLIFSGLAGIAAKRRGGSVKGFLWVAVVSSYGAVCSFLLFIVVREDTKSVPASLSACIGVLVTSFVLTLNVYRVRSSGRSLALATVLSIFLLGSALTAYKF
jgi:hypothetical protein